MTNTDMVIGILCGVVLLLLCVWIVVSLYLAYTKMDVMQQHLKNSPSVRDLNYFLNLGPSGKLVFMNCVSRYVAWPRKHIAQGGISAEDLDSLPIPLKRTLVILGWSVTVLAISMLLLYSVAKVIEWSH